MSLQRITDSLAALFAVQPIVFWHDAEGEFAATVDNLVPDNAALVRLQDTPALQVKLAIERQPGQCWLLYSTQPEPDPYADWLLDIRLRSKSFKADSASILLAELGLVSQTLRGHLKARAKFLRSSARVGRLKRLVLASDTADDLDRKMLAVLVRADQPELFAILLRLFVAFVQEGEVDLNAQPKIWQDIIANDLEEAFWQAVKTQLGYAEAKPGLRDLLFRILVTDFSRSVLAKPVGALQHFVLPERRLAANASVFASRWRADMAHYSSYNLMSAAVGQDLALAHLLSGLSADDLAEVMTFEDVERRIISDLKDRVLGGAGAALEAVLALIARRRDGHWANPILANTHDVNRALAASYDALEAAIHFLALKDQYQDGFSFASGKAGFLAYQTGLFRFDQGYRHFNRAYELVEPMGWSVLHEVKQRIEAAYSGWFMPQLSSAWGNILEGGSGLLSSWQLPGVINQQHFFAKVVAPLSDDGAKRVFVVISDAFRFEVAEELAQAINSKSRIKASLSAMLGVLPSYTGLGMAALLPHQRLAYKINSNLELSADGKPVSSMEQRGAYLGLHGGAAIKAEDLVAMGKEKGREFVRDRRLIYIYHDRIDLIGDKQASETKTFEAAADTVIELAQLVGFIVNSLNGYNVLVTADHGFIYQEAALAEADKSVLADKPEGTLLAKKRYVLGQGLGTNAKAWSGNTALTAGTGADGSLDFWLPKGINRFHFTGGARFVHGGAMPQEIVVPVITVRASESELAKTKAASISLLGASNKVVTNTQRFEFIQNEAVSERVLPRTVVVCLRDGDQPISNEQTVTFDSPSQLLDERKRSVVLTVLSGAYDRNKDYFLVARDATTKVEMLRVPLQVDLAFSNDF
ncbi:BREX-1 system phosphatase PglZ type A [Methylovulum psychrotolerans]|uniref:BREX-1 system phosphatase PglZ type A n=1 Tax=Methylovulum psychrotolerans TaxID=1704499 RepID=A0A2S5CGU5_9GAMM|nr:BREX-1 system phosphatase PglZ type A [Methylovulum psychrotolerans]POZ49962.1 BREX-1 system phosphatase PglZ type A [Methylovulum psychrotolerans]